MALGDVVLVALRGIVGDRVRTGPAQLLSYSYDGTSLQAIPDAVIEAHTTDEVSRVLAVANRERIPVVTRGSGTSLAGGTIPLDGGIVLNLAAMNRIIEIDTANAVAVVEPGVVNATLQAAVEAVGLFYPPDPASLRQCSIGGNVACNAGGPRCLKYGSTRDYVIGMTAVLADGRVLELGGKTVKNASGFQLLQLIVGSEGTLAAITRVVLKLRPLPRYRATASAFFPSLDDAARAVSAIIAAGILPSSLEILDGLTIRTVENYAKLGLPLNVDAMLILEQDGSTPESPRHDVDQMAVICREQGAADIQVAEGDAERDQIWRARQAAGGAVGQLAPDKLSEDIVVPRAQVPELIRRIRQVAEETGLPIPTWGHAGDGNLHPAVMYDRKRPGDLERVEQAGAGILRAAIELGGTLSGEHGIGSLKREFLEDDLGPEVVAVMRSIKQTLDPNGILNPHKLFPTGSGPDRSGFIASLPSLPGLWPG